MIDQNPAWEEAIKVEALNFVAAVQQNFRHGLTTSLRCLPDAKDPEHRTVQLDYFIDALIGVAVQQVAEYASYQAEMEERIIEGVKRKFKYIREKRAEAQKPKLEVMS